MVLKQDGSVWAAGVNEYGQIGDGSTDHKSSFVQVVSGGAVAVAAGGHHSMVLKLDGSVWITGRNNFGQLGDDSPRTFRSTFETVMRSGCNGLVVAAGEWHSMILQDDGSLWGAGGNSYGQLGDKSRSVKTMFVEILNIDGAWFKVL